MMITPMIATPTTQASTAVAAPQVSGSLSTPPVREQVESADAIDGAALLTRNATAYIPTSDGRVIIVHVPDGLLDVPGRDRPSLVGSRPSARPTPADERELANIKSTVADVRKYYASVGVRDDEGNDGSAVIQFNPRYPNASYAPEGIPEIGVPRDSITVGVEPDSGKSFGAAKDVVAHEWGHRVIDRLTKGTLEMSPLSSDVAVHETLADTLAAAFDSDDWLLGEELSAPVRDMKNPERLGHPSHVNQLDRALSRDSPLMHPLRLPDGRVTLVPDWHGIAGIPNKAAHLIGESIGRDNMAKVYVHAAREHIRGGQGLDGYARAVIMAARDVFGDGSRELQATRQAWDAVGLLELADKAKRP